MCRAPADIPGVGRFAVVADPQGAVLNVFTPNQSRERARARAPGHVEWHELHTTTSPQALDCYQSLFGWAKGDAMNTVGNIEASASRIRQAGGTVRQGPHRVTESEWMLQAMDPQGAGFALLGHNH